MNAAFEPGSLLRRALRQAGAMLLLALLPAVAAWTWQRPAVAPFSVITRTVEEGKAPAGEMVLPAQARAWGKSVLWIDARPKAEYDRAHIEGAELLNEDDWDGLLPAFLQSWTPGARVVVYCDGGACQASRQVAARLRDTGVAPVYVLQGGWPAWQKQTAR